MNPQAVDLNSVRREERLIASLLHERAYPHPVDKMQLLETHISWVILTGRFAYKIKKPIKLEFLDFSSLERRKFFCNEELRLNRRWAPELYLEVVPICGDFEKPVVCGDGTPIEYAVRMLQFPQVMQLDEQLHAGLLLDADMIELAEMIAAQHGTAAVAEQLDSKDAIESIRHPMLANIEHLKMHLSWDELQGLSSWTSRNGIVAFDCVEFSAELRNVDVISDVSFLVMDLISRDRQDLAYVFINRYLERTGDYAGMAVFGLYYVYHALIRAKVAAIRSVEWSGEVGGQHSSEEIAHCCAVARRWIVSRRPFLIAMHGFSGSGKTSLSEKLISRLPAIRVRSDIERKRAYGLEETERSGARVGKGIYDRYARARIYGILAAVAEVTLRLGQNVIVDASFLYREDRQHFHALAKRLNADFLIVDTCAEPDELHRRVHRRQRDAGDASEADANVLQYQFENAEPLGSEELEWTVTVATDTGIDADTVIKATRR